jgi:hypothetical protein
MRVKFWRLVNGYHIWKENFAQCQGQAVQEEKVLLEMVDPGIERATNKHTVTIYQFTRSNIQKYSRPVTVQCSETKSRFWINFNQIFRTKCAISKQI